MVACFLPNRSFHKDIENIEGIEQLDIKHIKETKRQKYIFLDIPYILSLDFLDTLDIPACRQAGHCLIS